MNKEVIYIEPEDDITDIISKIEKSKEKIVALVPPKKAGVFRSVVNIKLINKAATASEKTVVLVTTDPSITKLAAATKLPVTKDLKTAPKIPEVEEELVETVSEEVVEEPEEEDKDSAAEEKEEVSDEDEDKEDEDSEAADDVDDEEEEGNSKKDKKSKKAAKKLKAAGGKIAGKMKLKKKLIIFGVIGLILLVLALVWAFVVAPAANVTVEIKTTLNNFSENISFTSVITEENADEGKFYLEETKIENVVEKTFEATGTKNVGEKATGSVVVFAYFPYNISGSVAINTGSQFTISDLTYSASEATTLVYGGNKAEGCDNKDNKDELLEIGCKVSAKISVIADAPGTAYNIESSKTGWSTTARVSVYSDENMTGGTDKTVAVVQQSDIDKAVSEIETSSEEAQKEALLAKVKPDTLVISSSFITTTSDPVSTPAVGEGVTPSVKVVTTSTIFSIDETKVKEFIAKKAHINEGQKIYTIKDPFIDNFAKVEGGYTGKLKTSYAVGPEVTESSVVETVKGKGLGEAYHALKDINGVSSVTINPSFPWVTFVPNDENKITVDLEVKE